MAAASGSMRIDIRHEAARFTHSPIYSATGTTQLLKMKAFTGFALAAAVAYTSLEAVSAMPSYVALIPNGAALGGEALGHDGGSTSGKFTKFGDLFREKGKTWAGVCNEKFPGKDFTVGAAFGDACCVWKGEGASPEAAPKWDAGVPTEGTKCATAETKAPTTAPTTAPTDKPTPAPQASSAAPASSKPTPAPATSKPAPASGKPTPAPPTSGKPTPAPTGKPGSGKCRTKEDGPGDDHKQGPMKPGKPGPSKKNETKSWDDSEEEYDY